METGEEADKGREWGKRRWSRGVGEIVGEIGGREREWGKRVG